MADAAQRALSGRRVLEIAGESGVYCGKLLADMGADVVKVERPGGDATRFVPPFWRDTVHPDHSLFFFYHNTNKRSVTLDLDVPDDRDRFATLANSADLIVETLPPGALDALGLGYEFLRSKNPRLVMTSITGFGQSGPWRDFESTDLVASALAGSMQVIGHADDPPVRLAGSQAHVIASTCAAASSLIALWHADESGTGQHVDVSVHEAMTAATHICGASKFLDDGIVPRRWGNGLFASVPSGTYTCTDGLVYLMVNRPLHWKALARWIHEETGNEVVLDPMFEGPSSVRQPNRDLLDHYIGELTARHTVSEIYHEGQRRHLAFTPLNTAQDVAGDEHLAARGFFVHVNHPSIGSLRVPGAPYRHSATPWAIGAPAPRVGEHNEEIDTWDGCDSDPRSRYAGGVAPHSPGLPRQAATPGAHARRMPATDLRFEPPSPPSPSPSPKEGEGEHDGKPRSHALSGLRIIEFTAGMAGPWIGRFMAWCGAEVIKIESRRFPDVTRLYVPARAPEMGIQSQLSPWFTDWNAGKKFVALDLTHPQGVELAKQLVAQADVVVDNYSTGVLDKLGLGYEVLRAVKSDLVTISSTGFGDSGPCRGYVTWGSNIEALSGLATLSGFPHRDCTVTQFAYPDPLSALHGLFAVMCALHHRRRTGEGQRIDLAQYEVSVAAIGEVILELLANGNEPARRGNRSRRDAPHGCYRCAGDDRWCAITVTNDVEWRELCRVMGRPECESDPNFATPAARLARVDEVDAMVGEWTSTREDYEVMNLLQAAGIAAGVVQNTDDQLRRDPQLAARGHFESIEHAVKGRVVANGIPLGLTGTPGRTGLAGAAIGQDNEEIFGRLLGMSGRDIEACVAAGAIEAGDRIGAAAPR